MIEKIISNGQSTAAVAALDVAIKLGLNYGGWCREGHAVDEKYRLDRVDDAARRSIGQRCVGAADGSLFFTQTAQTSLACQTTKKMSLRMNRPFLVMNLDRERGFSASRVIAGWIVDNHIKVLHVDGDADVPGARSLGRTVTHILEATFFLALADTGITSPLQSVVRQERFPQQEAPPQTIAAALSHLERSLSLKDRATIANMLADELVSLQFSLGNYINNHFDLFTTNAALLADCQRVSGGRDLAPKDAAAVIIRALWDRLRSTCRIRIVK